MATQERHASSRRHPVAERDTAAARDVMARDVQVAGGILTAVGIVLLLGITTLEALYAGRYSTFANTISDLGSSNNRYLATTEPNHLLYVVLMIVTGVAVVVAAGFLARARYPRGLVVGIEALGIGLVGIGCFSQDQGVMHATFALGAVVGAAGAAIWSRRVIRGRFGDFAVGLGVLALVGTGLGLPGVKGFGGIEAAIGVGGVERWAVYPVFLWLFGFGVSLLARQDDAA
jgi:hypothetical membrane protein